MSLTLDDRPPPPPPRPVMLTRPSSTVLKSGAIMVSDSMNTSTGPRPMTLLLLSDKLIFQPTIVDSNTKTNDPPSPSSSASSSSSSASSASSTADESLNHHMKPVKSAATLSSSYRTVTLSRHKSIGLGLHVKGGAEHSLPVLISGMTRNGPADKSRALFIGDAIVAINDTSLSPVATTHEQAIRLLKTSGPKVTLTVKHFQMVKPFLDKAWRKKNMTNKLIVNGEASDGSEGDDLDRSDSFDLLDMGCLNRSLDNGSSNDTLDSGGTSRIEVPLQRPRELKIGPPVTGSVRNSTRKTFDQAKQIVIELVNCYLTKYIHDSDKSRDECFEVRYSPLMFDASCSDKASEKSSSNYTKDDKYNGALLVSCENKVIRNEWIDVIESAAMIITLRRMRSINAGLKPHEHILFTGWVAEGRRTKTTSAFCDDPHRPCLFWSPRYFIIIGGQLRLYPLNNGNQSASPVSSASSIDTSSEPEVLRAHECVIKFLQKIEQIDERDNCFKIVFCRDSDKKKSVNYVHQLYLSIETKDDLQRIRNAWIRATYLAVTQLSSKTFAVTSDGICGSLTLDWKIGFAFYDPDEKQYCWRYKFSQLRKSCDDGGNILHLTFSSSSSTSSSSLPNTSVDSKNVSSTETRSLHCNELHRLIYCMHAFLTAKVASVDPSFLNQQTL